MLVAGDLELSPTFLDFFTPMGPQDGKFWPGSVKNIWGILRKYLGYLILQKYLQYLFERYKANTGICPKDIGISKNICNICPKDTGANTRLYLYLYICVVFKKKIL